MEKKFILLAAVVLVFSGWSWGGDDKKEVDPPKSPVAQTQSANTGYAWGQKKEVKTPAMPAKKAAMANTDDSALPLSSLTSGTEEERRARIESLVRFSKAMKAKREAEEAAKKKSYY